ncbi:hypothetical protein AN958_02649 [Leucoagaricus sp. SymC.cos]|nr:hypothetical protein AN958_02649 [Leucoagaricus sp. SymC.cos]
MHIHIVHILSLFSMVFWTVCSWLWSYPISLDYSIWEESDPNKYQAWKKEQNHITCIWCFLHPFFTSKGYECYIQRDPTTFTSQTIPHTKHTAPYPEVIFPYAHYCCENDEQVHFSLCMSDMMHFFSLLMLIFSTLRWSFTDQRDFINVGKLVQYGQAFFEVTTFLYEHKITHSDLNLQNLFMDVILLYMMEPCYAGLCGPQCRYGLIDFEALILGPDDGLLSSPELEKAFKEDVSLLGKTLEINL